MKKQKTLEQRATILETIEREGLTDPAAAKRFGITERTLRNWRPVSKRLQLRRERRSSTAEVVRVLRTKAPALKADGALARVMRARIRTAVGTLYRRIVAEEISAQLDGARRRARTRRT